MNYKITPFKLNYKAFLSILNLCLPKQRSSILNTATLHSIALSLFNFLIYLSTFYSLVNFFVIFRTNYLNQNLIT